MTLLLCALVGAVGLMSGLMADANTQLVTSSSNAFGIELYKKVSKAGENTVICPLSLHIALTLLNEGAKGKSKLELESVLGLTNLKDVKDSYKTLLNSFKGDTLKIATKLFPAEGFTLNPDFSSIAQNYYQSDVQKLNYQNPAGAADTINKYVEEKTNNKIHDLIKEDALTDLTRLVLVNAVYFNAKWKSVFEHSYDSDFHVNETERAPVKFMTQTGNFAYKDDANLDAKVLKMDYTDEGYSMIFVLPNKKMGLAEVEAKMAQSNLPALLENLKVHKVEVVIPKFKIEQTHNLKNILNQMGIKDIFSSRADLSKLATGENIFVSDVIQKTYIKVHENGTEAAAATAAYVELLSAPSSDERSFYAKRPFFFSIVHQGSVLFKGKLIRPEFENDPGAVVYPDVSLEQANTFLAKNPIPTRPPTIGNVPPNQIQNNQPLPQSNGQNRPMQNSGSANSQPRPTSFPTQGGVSHTQYENQDGVSHPQYENQNVQNRPMQNSGVANRRPLPTSFPTQGGVSHTQYGNQDEDGVRHPQYENQNDQNRPMQHSGAANSQTRPTSFPTQGGVSHTKYENQDEDGNRHQQYDNQNVQNRPMQHSGAANSQTRPTSFPTQGGVSHDQYEAQHPQNGFNNQRYQPQNNYNLVKPEPSRDSSVQNSQVTERPGSGYSWDQSQDSLKPNPKPYVSEYPNDEPKYENTEENFDRSGPFEKRIFFIFRGQDPPPLANFGQIVRG